MLRAINILFFYFVTSISYGQGIEAFPTSAGAWKIRHSHIDCCPTATSISYHRKFVDGDTIINSTIYHKLYIGSSNVFDTTFASLIAYYRTENNKVYFKNAYLNNLDYSGYNDTIEHLLYDYTLDIGDSILHYDDGLNQYYLILQDYYLVPINGVDRYRFDFISTKPWYYPEIYWIDGIGSSMGFFNYNYYLEGQEYLYCFYDGVDEFPILSGDCSMTSVNELTIENEFSIFPNPTNAEFKLNFNEIKKGIINIHDLNGKLVFEEIINSNSVTINPNLPNGIYQISFLSKFESINSKLVITN